MNKADWLKIRKEYEAGLKLRELAEKYNLNFETVKYHHRKEHWSRARKKTLRRIDEETTNKLVESQSQSNFDEISLIQEDILDLKGKAKLAEVISAEGAYRTLGSLYEKLGTYTHKTIQKIETEHSFNFGNAVKQILEKRKERKQTNGEV